APAPIWNVNAPCTGCESADTTRQVTTYPPAGRSGGTFSDTALPFPAGGYGSPLSTRRPWESYTRIEPSEIPTCSSKTIATTPGEDPRTAPSAGAVRSSTAWASADGASPDNADTTQTEKTSHRAPRTITTHLTAARITRWPTRKA